MHDILGRAVTLLLLIASTSSACKTDEKPEPAAKPRATQPADDPAAAEKAQEAKALQALCSAHGSPSPGDGIRPIDRLRKASDWAHSNINHRTVDGLLLAGDSWYDLDKAGKEIAAVALGAGIEDCGLVGFFRELSTAKVDAEQAGFLLKSLDVVVGTDWQKTAMLAAGCAEVVGCARSCALTLFAISNASSTEEAQPLLARCDDLEGAAHFSSMLLAIEDRILETVETARDGLDETQRKMLDRRVQERAKR